MQSVVCLLALAILSCAEEEKKPVEDKKAEDTVQAEASEKKDKRGIYEYGDHGSSHDHGHHGHHEEKTLTIVKKVPVPVPHYKTVHVPVVKEVHVPYHVKVPKPYPVVKHVPYTVKEIVKVPVHVDKPYPVEKVAFNCNTNDLIP